MRHPLALATLAVLLAGCGLTASRTAPPPTVAGPLIAITTRGGLCAGGPCDRTVTLSADGTLRTAAKPPNELAHIPPAEVEKLQGLLAAADIPAMLAKPFTGQCPTAVDGTEVVVTVWKGDTMDVLEGCKVALDWTSPLLREVAVVFGSYAPLPVR